MEIENINSLDGFGGFEQFSSETDFFSQQDTEQEIKTDAQSVIEELVKEDKVEGEEGKATPPSKEKDLFSDNPEEEEEDDNNEEDEDKTIPGSNVSTLNILKEKGIIDYELEEGEELTEELAAELIEDGYEESVDNKVKALLTELPDDKKNAVQYLIKGGSLVELVNALTKNTGIDINADLEKEENQISVLKQLLKLEDKDDEEVEAEIEYLKDSGKLKAMSEKKLDKYKANYQSRQKELAEEQEERREQEKKALREAKAKISDFLTKNSELNGITFNKEDKKTLPSYMNDKTIKLQNGTLITPMQKELFYDLPKNETALIQLATLLKNRNEDGTFNFDSIVKNAKTKVTQEIRKEFRRDKQSIPGNSTNKGKQSNKSLADYFNT